MEITNVSTAATTQAQTPVNTCKTTQTACPKATTKPEADTVEIKNAPKDVNFKGNMQAVKGKAALNVLKKVGSAAGVIAITLLSGLGALLPGDSANDNKIKSGINDKDTSDYCGTKSGDLYCFYGK